MGDFLKWCRIFTLNVCVLVYSSVNITPREISFKHTLQMWTIFNQYQIEFDNLRIISELFLLISSKVVGNRAGRIEPRAVKKRHNNMPRLMKPRDIAREEIRVKGHPKKLK